jgi:hypothetical protein
VNREDAPASFFGHRKGALKNAHLDVGMLTVSRRSVEANFPYVPRLRWASALCSVKGPSGGRTATGETRRVRTFPSSPRNAEVRPLAVVHGAVRLLGEMPLAKTLSKLIDGV